MGADMAKKKRQQATGDPTYSVAELKRAVQGKEEAIAPHEALRSLVYRRAPELGRMARRIAKDPEAPTDLRKTAAIELGRSAGAANREALLELLSAEDPGVTRRAAEGLGRIGDAAALEKLKSIRPRDPVVKRAVSTAKTLLSYRLNETSGRLALPEPREVLELGKAKARALEVGTVAPTTIEAMQSELQGELPEVPVSTKGGLELDCGEGHYRVVFNEALEVEGGLLALMESNAVVGAVLKRTEVDGRYSLDSYLLSHPSYGVTARLFAMKASGVVSYYGELTQSEGGVEFSLRALNTRYSQPVELEGRITAQSLVVHLETAKVAVGRTVEQLPPKRPRQLGVR
jgi:hypothetical protein